MQLIEKYEAHRIGVAEDILNSARATNFMTPKTPNEALFCAQTLHLAATQLCSIFHRIGIRHDAEHPCFVDHTGLVEARYGSGHTYLIRPDRRIGAVFQTLTKAALHDTYTRTMGEQQ